MSDMAVALSATVETCHSRNQEAGENQEADIDMCLASCHAWEGLDVYKTLVSLLEAPASE